MDACAEQFLHRLEQARTRRHADKPMVLLGFRTGCLVIEKAVAMAGRQQAGNGSMRNLAGVFFFDAPHTGLPDHVLDKLPEGRSKNIIVDELTQGSRTLQELDAEFARTIGTTTVVSCLPSEALGSACSSNWTPHKVVIIDGRREAIAQLHQTPQGQYRRVLQEIKQCLNFLHPAHRTPKDNHVINFSLPARSPKSPLRLHHLPRKDSLSPLSLIHI